MTISDFPAPLYLPDSEQHPEERCLVPSPSGGIKPVNYCTSFRQRERTCFRQLIFRPNGLWSIQPSLRMLTYHLSPLSNPVNPKISFIPDFQRIRNVFKTLCVKNVQLSTSISTSITLYSVCKSITFIWKIKTKTDIFIN